MIHRTLLAAVALAALPTHAAVTVTFTDPDRYTDAANQRWETQSTLDALEKHMRKLGDRYLAPDENLRIEVLDIDLAGWARFGGRGGKEVRVVRGQADFPSMRVRYTLESAGRTRAAEETISDLTYQNHGFKSRSSEPFYYEKQMLEGWFRSTFAQRPR